MALRYPVGTHFTWVTDHKSLEHILTQCNLSGRQVHWMERLSGSSMCLVRTMSFPIPCRACTNLTLLGPGTICAPSEFVKHDLPPWMCLMPSTRLPLLFCLRPSWLAVRPWLPHLAGVLVLWTSRSPLLWKRHVASPFPHRQKSHLLHPAFLLRVLAQSRLADVVAHQR